MNRTILLAFSIFWATALFGQVPTWSEDIAPMIYGNCSKCHHEGTAAPFSLMSYDDMVENSLTAYFAMEEGWMPPWPADPEYRHFIDEPDLTDEDIADILTWIENGHPFGDPELEPAAPTFETSGSLLDHVDFVAAIEPYTLQYNTDETRWFVIPTNFSETKYINGIEVIAGTELVHHADISIDATSTSANYDVQDPLPGFNSQTGSPNYSFYMNAWQPGAGPARYPDNWGIPLYPGENLVLEIHYGPGGAEMIDETIMNLQFVDDPVNVRPISVGWLLGGGNMTDGPLVMPPNQISIFHQEAVPFNSDKSLISICPHMHLIGASYKVWMVTPDNVSVPLVYVDHWDFHWQFYYTYPYIQKIPAGSTIYSEAVYDNTVTSPYQPNNPPITIQNGPNTTDEMILTYFIYANYQEGDEDISMTPPTVVPEIASAADWRIFPNPTASDVTLIHQHNLQDQGSIEIFDMAGALVYTEKFSFVGRTFTVDTSDLPAGSYQLQWTTGKGSSARSFVKI
jgi:mono/diheme cytochrome c family protein